MEKENERSSKVMPQGLDPKTGKFAPGNQLGRGKQKRNIVFQRLNELVQAEHTQDISKLDAILHSMINLAIKGSTKAASIIFDRLDGKPGQSLRIEDEREKDEIVIWEEELERLSKLDKHELIAEYNRIVTMKHLG